MTKYAKHPDRIAALSPEEFHVTQRSGTERPGTGRHLSNKEPGIYVDIVSGEPLFASSDKYESGCGWPFQGYGGKRILWSHQFQWAINR